MEGQICVGVCDGSLRPEFDEECPADFRELTARCWAQNPETRWVRPHQQQFTAAFRAREDAEIKEPAVLQLSRLAERSGTMHCACWGLLESREVEYCAPTTLRVSYVTVVAMPPRLTGRGDLQAELQGHCDSADGDRGAVQEAVPHAEAARRHAH